MTGRGGILLSGASALFVAFFANVSAGAAGLTPVLGDIGEMLTLFAAAMLFVAGVLMREAAERNDTNKND